MRQAERISSSQSYQWMIFVLLMTPRFTATQYASSPYNGHFDGYNQQPQAQALPLPLQQLQQFGYADTSLTYNPVYPSPVQSRWSGAPIVVNDEANILEQEHQQQQQQQQPRQYFPINYYNNRDSYASGRPDSGNPNWYNTNNQTPTRAANHNYNNGAYYYTQPQQELESRELLAVSDSRRPDDQIVRIGGSRSLANSKNNNIYRQGEYYNRPDQSLGQRDFQAKYAKHYSDYLRKYPYRLQPFYNSFVEK